MFVFYENIGFWHYNALASSNSLKNSFFLQIKIVQTIAMKRNISRNFLASNLDPTDALWAPHGFPSLSQGRPWPLLCWTFLTHDYTRCFAVEQLSSSQPNQDVGSVQSTFADSVQVPLRVYGGISETMEGIHWRSISVLGSNCQRIPLEKRTNQRRFCQL